MPKSTPDKVTKSSRFSRIHFLVSAVTLRGPWEAETSCPPILANRYSENRAEDFSSISLGRQQAAYQWPVLVVYEQADPPADLPKLPSRDLSRLTAGPRQHHDDDGLPFWGCFGKSVQKDQSLAPTRRRSSLTAWRMPTNSIVVPGWDRTVFLVTLIITISDSARARETVYLHPTSVYLTSLYMRSIFYDECKTTLNDSCAPKYACLSLLSRWEVVAGNLNL